MAAPAGGREGARAAAGIVDCDVHPMRTGDLYRYLPAHWRRRLELRELDFDRAQFFAPGRIGHPLGSAAFRRDATPPSGRIPGSDPGFMAADLLDRHGISSALLISIEASTVNAWQHADEAAALASAWNDYFLERWLPVDPRYRYALTVAPQDAALAAAELRRLGTHPQVVAVHFGLTNLLMGDRHYHALYAAAEDLGLPVVIHVNGTEGQFQGCAPYAGGILSSYAERYCDHFQLGIAQLTSLVFEGTFERFPRLKVVLAEFGWAWVAPLLFRMDAAWKALRYDTPWVRRLPSEYVADHVRFTSQPAAEVPPAEVEGFLRAMHGDRTVLFSTDYPHHDLDDPALTFRGLDAGLRRRIFGDSARETFGERL